MAGEVEAMRLVQWTRCDGVRLTPEGEPLRVIYTFTVSRLGREYR